MNSSRRSVVKKGLLGGALLTLGGAGFLAFKGTRLLPLPPEGLVTFDGKEYAVVSAIAARLIPPREGFPSLEEVRVAYNSDRILARASADARKEVKQLIGLFENALAGFLFGARTQPFTELSAEAQDAVLLEWQNSKITVRRTGFQALRSLILAAYYGAPLSWKATRYPGPPEGFHQADAPVWKGGGEPRPPSNGIWVEEEKP